MAQTDIVAGIDIGGTNTKIGLVDREGHCLSDSSIATNAHEEAHLLIGRIARSISEQYFPLKSTHALRGLGIGAPNANYYKGTVEYPPNLAWPGVTDVVGMVKGYFPVPVAITNDANAAALGEMLFGAGRGCKDFIVITLGTGLGSGLIVNGELVYGHDGFAGELGHTTVDPEGRECGCGRRGCLETYASAPGICKTVHELFALRRVESELRKIPFERLTAVMVSEAALRKDPIALEAFEFTGKVLGGKLADSILHTSPAAIILFGGLASAGDLIFEPTKRHMEASLLNIFKGKVRLIPSGLQGEVNAAVLGSAALIWNELEKS